jgi:hypothetical protein
VIKRNLKNLYNYFLQVQTLINQQAIEVPGEKNDGSFGNLGNYRLKPVSNRIKKEKRT